MANTTKRKPLIAGNWKMNGLLKSKAEITKLAKLMVDLPSRAADVFVCPPATLLFPFKELVKGTKIVLGAEDCHQNESGAHTGDLSAEMLREAGAKWIIVGHSERRTDHGETDALVANKARAALRAKCGAIICVGETETERDQGKTLNVIARQLKNSIPADMTAKNLVVAYEPVWAIGTGRTPTLKEIRAVHRSIRKKLVKSMGDEGQKVRILYGGSVKPTNADEILVIEDVDGALVGGASLRVQDFWGIIKTYG
jgi:triosephosphate isomerase